MNALLAEADNVSRVRQEGKSTMRKRTLNIPMALERVMPRTGGPMRKVIFIAEMLTDIQRGIYTQWVYYSDGSVEEVKIPKGKLIIPLNPVQL